MPLSPLRHKVGPAVLAAGALALSMIALNPSAAQADGPGVGTPYVVAVGDSYISGEAGRWAGNSNEGEAKHDAGGSTTYFDNASNTGESAYKCHRSKQADIHIGGGTLGKNLSCSGAKTTTTTSVDGVYRPGIDFANTSDGKGQALELQTFAATHNVKMVAVSIGGNDFDFAGIVTQCVADFLGSPSWWPNYCKDDSIVTNNFSSAAVTARRAEIAKSFQNIRTAMRNAGYADNAWTLMVQNYMSPLPNGSGIRYSQSGYTRQSTGGCGFWNADADYANGTLLPRINQTVSEAGTASGLTNIKTLNLATAFNGRRLCENTVGLIEEKGLTNWTGAGAVDKTEWINTIRTASATGNYYIQESFHPNYWGQLAMRNCMRKAWNGGAVKSGTCVRGANGLTAGEPNMILQ